MLGKKHEWLASSTSNDLLTDPVVRWNGKQVSASPAAAAASGARIPAVRPAQCPVR